MTVLDMCAAPGSKAAQLIEMVHGGEEARMRKALRQLEEAQGREPSPDPEIIKEELKEEEGPGGDWSDDGRATGLLIANDSDYKRAHMLTHQMKRLNSPNLIVTNHDATMFPSIKLPPETSTGKANSRSKYLKFDRILADVPCSGDGTGRKNVNIWKDWTPGNALGLYIMQVRILVRALQMLKVGGRVVYSTCSMNPVENEAAVCSAIDRCGGLNKVDLVDTKEALPKLKRHSGLSTWEVMDKSGRLWKSWDDVEDDRSKSGGEGLSKLAEGMFPPSDAAARRPELSRAMRIYPHLQDTGGFFICVLEKKAEIKVRPDEGTMSTTMAAANKDDTQASDIGDALNASHENSAPSIIDTVNEIESLLRQTDDSKSNEGITHLTTLDSILPPPLESANDAEMVSTAARQNMENPGPSNVITGAKRERDAGADAISALKRPKFREQPNDPVQEGYEDRREHWPPPPGAKLELTRPPVHDETPSAEKVTASTTTHNSVPNVNSNHNGANVRTTARTTATPRKLGQPFEEPFHYLPYTHTSLAQIRAFYTISPRFPMSRFMVRNATAEAQRTIYYTSSLARDILTTNAGSGIKFVHCGVKMFVRQDVQAEEVCPWRIQSEGLPILAGWVGERRTVRLWKKSTLRMLLMEMFPKVEGGGWRSLGEIGGRVRDIGMGCCVLKVGPPPQSHFHPESPSKDTAQVQENGNERDDEHGQTTNKDDEINHDKAEEDDDVFDTSHQMVLPLWRSLHSLNLMLPKEDRRAMLLRLFNDDTPLKDSSKDRFKKKNSAAPTADAINTTIPRKQEGGQGGAVKAEEVQEEEEVVVGESNADIIMKSDDDDDGDGDGGGGGDERDMVDGSDSDEAGGGVSLT